jgi:hypothetical protein
MPLKPALAPASPQWSFRTAAAVRGLVLAREAGTVLAWDEQHWLYLLDRNGQPQAQLQAPRSVSTLACADDGSWYAAGGSRGEVWQLAPDLMPRWQRALAHPAVALAVEPLGRFLAVSDASGGVHCFSHKGRLRWQLQTPRALHHLAFIPETPFLVGAADLGLAVGFDLAGAIAWREPIIASVGGLAVSGDGSVILLACYSDGLGRLALHGGMLQRVPLAEPARLVGLSYDGRTVLVAGLSERLLLVTPEGQQKDELFLEEPPLAVALGPLAERITAGLPSGQIVNLRRT